MSAEALLLVLTQALFVVIFAVVAVKAMRQPRRATIETGLFFGVAALLVAAGWVAAALRLTASPGLTALSIVLIVALPYLLLRLVNAFAGVPRPVMRLAAGGLAATALSGIVLAGRPLPVWLILCDVVYFVGLTLYATVMVVRATGRASGVTRRRLQAVAAGSFCLGLTILLVGLKVALPLWAPGWALLGLGSLCALTSGLAYFVGFAPPLWLRQAWQGPDLRAFLGHAAGLSHLPDTRAIVRAIEAGVATSVGAPAAWIGLWDEDAGLLRGEVAGGAAAVRPGERIAGQAFAAQQPLLWVDATRADPTNADRYRARGATTVLAAPITAGEKRLGVLVAYAAQAPLFIEDDLVLLQVLADQAAVILENRALVDEMARASQVKSAFLATMSHELRTPLNAIIGFSEVLHDGTFGFLNERQQRYVGNVLESGRHLLALINDVLDLSKVEAGRMELHREDLDLRVLLAEVQQTLRPLAQSKGVDLCDATGAPEATAAAVVSADRTRLVQIVYNLLSNALKFTPPGGAVTVGVAVRAESVAIAVTDTGIGIAPEDQARIFEEFQQVDSAVGRTQQGTGLGLALTRRLVALHGGTISVESVPGQGSTFTVVLPRGPHAVPTRGARGTVLVVEDNPVAGELLSVYLTRAGYGVEMVAPATASRWSRRRRTWWRGRRRASRWRSRWTCCCRRRWPGPSCGSSRPIPARAPSRW